MEIHKLSGQKVVIKHIHKAFEHKILMMRTLNDLKLLNFLKHEHVYAIDGIF
jgi:hypothetical protein